MEEGADFRAALDASCFLGAVPIRERFIDSINRGVAEVVCGPTDLVLTCERDEKDAFDSLWRRTYLGAKEQSLLVSCRYVFLLTRF